MAFTFILLVGIIILDICNAPWYFTISIVILYAGHTIADAIRYGSNKISNSINDSIRDAITEMKEANLEQKLK